MARRSIHRSRPGACRTCSHSSTRTPIESVRTRNVREDESRHEDRRTTVVFDQASHAGGVTHYATRLVKLIEAAAA